VSKESKFKQGEQTGYLCTTTTVLIQKINKLIFRILDFFSAGMPTFSNFLAL
jgi:hypothetical protein